MTVQASSAQRIEAPSFKVIEAGSKAASQLRYWQLAAKALPESQEPEHGTDPSHAALVIAGTNSVLTQERVHAVASQSALKVPLIPDHQAVCSIRPHSDSVQRIPLSLTKVS